MQRLRARIVELEETVEQNDPQNETHMLTLQLQQEQSENATLREDMQRQREEADGLKTRIAELEKEVKEKDAKIEELMTKKPAPKGTPTHKGKSETPTHKDQTCLLYTSPSPRD